MIPATPQRARSASAKQQRSRDILAAARRLATTRPVRDITLTDVAAEVCLHKSAMLRYFETREQIFLSVAAEEWQQWCAEVVAQLADAPDPAALLAHSLAARPLFCDLLAQVPLNLERNVSFEVVWHYKTTVLAARRPLMAELRRRLSLTEQQAADLIATATSMAGALWQMAAPGTALRAFYESHPDLAHAVVDVEPRLTRILTALVAGMR